jgi:hypothetical protein
LFFDIATHTQGAMTHNDGGEQIQGLEKQIKQIKTQVKIMENPYTYLKDQNQSVMLSVCISTPNDTEGFPFTKEGLRLASEMYFTHIEKIQDDEEIEYSIDLFTDDGVSDIYVVYEDKLTTNQLTMWRSFLKGSYKRPTFNQFINDMKLQRYKHEDIQLGLYIMEMKVTVKSKGHNMLPERLMEIIDYVGGLSVKPNNHPIVINQLEQANNLIEYINVLFDGLTLT